MAAAMAFDDFDEQAMRAAAEHDPFIAYLVAAEDEGLFDGALQAALELQVRSARSSAPLRAVWMPGTCLCIRMAQLAGLWASLRSACT